MKQTAAPGLTQLLVYGETTHSTPGCMATPAAHTTIPEYGLPVKPLERQDGNWERGLTL